MSECGERDLSLGFLGLLLLDELRESNEKLKSRELFIVELS